MSGLALALGWALVAAPLELEWAAPSGCPSSSDVTDRVRRLVGGAFDGPVRLEARASVEVSPSGWSAQLGLRTRSGLSERGLEAESCAALAEAVAVILALAVDRAPELRVPVQPTPPPEGGGDARRSGPVFALAADLASGSGHLPGVAVGVGVRLGLHVSELALGLGFLAWLPETVGDGQVSARVGLLAGELSLGRPFAFGPVELTPRVVIEVGRFEARGLGASLEEATQTAALHLSGGLGLVTSLNVSGPLWIHLRVEGLISVARPAVIVDERGTLFRVAAFSPRLGGGLEVRLP